MAKDLTKRQREVLEVIRATIDHRGYPPTMREIAAALGSRINVHTRLAALARKGYIERGVGARAIRLVYQRDDSADRALLAEAARVAPIEAVRAALAALPEARASHAA